MKQQQLNFTSNKAKMQQQLNIVLYVTFAIIIYISKSLAFKDVVDPRLPGKCSETSPCEDSSTTTNSTPINNSKPAKDFSMFLYAVNNNINASYPVIEYFEDDATIESMNEHLPLFLQMEPSHTYANHYVMVKYYKPHCRACKYAKDIYIKTASYMKSMFMEDERPRVSTSSSNQNNINLFQSYAISCQAYAHLCATSIHMYPTIRMYDMNTGNVIELDYRRMHPYSIMERLGFDDTTIHTNIYQLSKHIHRQNKEQSSRGSKLKIELLADNDPMKQVVDEIDYIYNHMKQTDLEQDLHATVDTMLRHYTYVPQNVNTTTKRSLRDPPLKTQSAQTLRIFLELLLRIISPVKNSHLQRFHSMIKELSTSFIYISKHAGYLPVILDEFRIQPRYVSKRKNDHNWNQYSKDCAPHQPNIVITSNDDDSPNVNNHNTAVPEGNKDKSVESSTAPYECGIWKLLFHMMVGGGLTNYNVVATSDTDKIPEIDMITMVRDYATHIGFGIWSEHEIQILYNTTYNNETDMKSSPNEYSEEMRLALWMGTIRNEIQRYRMIQEKEGILHERVTAMDLLAAQWPSRHDCPNCWNNEPRRKSYTESDNEYMYDREPQWNDQAVYKYIQLEYGTAPDNIDDLVQLYMDVHPEEFDSYHHDEL